MVVDLNSYYIAIQVTGILGLIGCLFVIITYYTFKDIQKLRFIVINYIKDIII